MTVNLFAAREVSQQHQVSSNQRTLVLYDVEKVDDHAWQLCPCCDKKMAPSSVQQMSLGCAPEDLSFLGPSVCLYFSIVKSMLVFMCLPLAGALTCVVINYIVCGYQAVLECLGEIDSAEDILFTQLCILFGIWVAAALEYPFSSLKFLKGSIKLLLRRPTVSDYTVKVSGIERLEDPEELCSHMQSLMQQFDGRCPEIEDVYPAYNISSLQQIQKELEKWGRLLNKIETNGLQLKIRRCRPVPMITEDICKQKIREWTEEKDKLFANIHKEQVSAAFVAFRYPYDARRFIDSFSVPFFIRMTRCLKHQLCCKRRRKYKRGSQRPFEQMNLSYKRPSHPEDVCFENLSLPFNQWLKRQALTVSISVALLFAAGLILYGFRSLQKTLGDEGAGLELETVMLSLLISVVILAINVVLELVMALITKGERQSSHTAYKTSVARKLITLMFINTAIVPTVVSAYAIEDDYHEDWFTKTEIWIDVYIIVTVNALFPPLFYFYLFNPLWWMNRLNKRSLDLALSEGSAGLLQSEANEIYTPLEIDFSERYAQVIKTLYVGLFFSPIVPMSIPLSMLGIGFDYWVTKYMLLRKHPKPMYHNEKLGLEMKDWMRYGLAVYAFGISFFYFKLNGNLVTTPETERWYNLEWISIAIGMIGFVYLCIPMNYLIKLKYFNRLVEEKIQNDEAYSVPYREKRFEFNTDFERANPALRRRARILPEDEAMAEILYNEDHDVRLPALTEQYREDDHLDANHKH